MKNKFTLHNFFSLLGDFIFPRICLICRKRIVITELADDLHTDNLYSSKMLDSDEYCCKECKEQINFDLNPEKLLNNLFSIFTKETLAIHRIISLFSATYDVSPMPLIHKLKYSGFTDIGFKYGILLGEALVKNNFVDYDYIVPVPIHRVRKRERGYNQSDFIAKGVQKVLNQKLPNIEIANDLLLRTENTPSQTLITFEERKSNLVNAFRVNSKYEIFDKKILLVDDVLTTGSTLNNCATSLLASSAKFVDVATLLKA